MPYTHGMSDAARGPVAAELTRRVEAELSPTRVALHDDSDQHAGHAGHDGRGESHFSLLVVSAAFEGLNRLQRQRLVFRAIGDLMQDRVHALQIQALTPEEA